MTLFILISSCTPILNVQSSYDYSVNFDKFRTYGWYQVETPVTRADPEYDTSIDQQIKAAVESELVRNGMLPSDVNAPDLLIAYDIALEPRPDQVNNSTPSTNFGFGYSYWYGYRYSYSPAGVSDFRNIQEYPMGALVIDLIDANTNELVWRGWAEADIDPIGIQERDLNRVVANIMSQYPPVPNLRR
ncbi:DUF4136 domain-containing protein [Pontibacter silvestris]|nr:DUF4136 domain-containing protein [Pontibacter silvestris]